MEPIRFFAKVAEPERVNEHVVNRATGKIIAVIERDKFVTDDDEIIEELIDQGYDYEEASEEDVAAYLDAKSAKLALLAKGAERSSKGTKRESTKQKASREKAEKDARDASGKGGEE